MSERLNHRSLPTRYGVLDALRGFAVVNMIAYHLCYDLFVVYAINTALAQNPAMILWEQMICWSFILVSGASLNLTHHAYRRGLILILSGFLITGITLLLIPSEVIWFGVLNLLGCAMILVYALQRVLNKVPPLVGAAASFGSFALLYGLPNGYLGFFGARIVELPAALYACRYLAFLGLPSRYFISSDYFPLLPWLFLYLCGYYLWRLLCERGWDHLFARRVPVLDFLGRYSFQIYLLHQPVLLGICFLIFGRF